MKKTIIFAIFAILLLSSTVMAATLTRTLPTTLTPGQSFTVTYSTSTNSGKWFVAWSDTITGCTPSAVNFFLSSGDPPVLTSDSKSFTFTAPQSGSCTFSGYYQFAGESQTNFPTTTVTVSGNPPPTTNIWLYVGIGAGILVLLIFLRRK